MFGRSKKIVVKARTSGGLKVAIGAKVVLWLFAYAEHQIGYEILPVELKSGIADLVVVGLGLAAEVINWHLSRGAVLNAAEATGEEAEQIKRDFNQ